MQWEDGELSKRKKKKKRKSKPSQPKLRRPKQGEDERQGAPRERESCDPAVHPFKPREPETQVSARGHGREALTAGGKWRRR